MKSDRIGGGWRSFGLGAMLSLAGHAAVLAWVASTSTAPADPGRRDPAALSVIVLALPAIVPAEPSRPPEVVSSRPVPPRPATVAAHRQRGRAEAAPAKLTPAPAPGLPDALEPDSARLTAAPADENAAPPAPAPVPSGRDDQDMVRRYAETVWAHLLAHRPRGLRQRGTVLLAFSLSRDGTLTRAEIAGPSGDAALDRAVLARLKAASPFPPPPAAMSDAALSFTVPVQVH